ncbi:MAG: MBL fold metallo-hydrolase [Alphaproteobacteria bacterium]
MNKPINPPKYKLDFDANYGNAVTLLDAPLVRRITAQNASPYTFKGTNTYLVGTAMVCVIDPGPNDPAHLRLICDTVEQGGGVISHILLTHTHIDHTAGVAELKRMTGAKTFGFGRHAQPSVGGDMSFVPDVLIEDGDELSGNDWALTAHHTPGHCHTHLCFSLSGTDILFSGDHVMGWSSSVIFLPDGDLGAYLNSLDKLETLQQNTYLPGHGDLITDGKDMAIAQKHHRLGRDAQYKALVEQGADLDAIVAAVYPNLNPALLGAARSTIEAHLEQGD